MEGNGARGQDWDLDFYAAALRINSRILAGPLVAAWRTINAAVGVVFLVGAVWFVYMMIDHQTVPVDFLEMAVRTPSVPAGGKLLVYFDINRVKICEVDPSWAVFGGDGQKYTVLAQHLDGGGPLGHDPFARAFQLPPDIKPGHGRFRAMWSWVCPLNFIDLEFARTAEAPDLPFEIVAPDGAPSEARPP